MHGGRLQSALAQTHQTKITAYNSHYRGLGDIHLCRYMLCGWLPWLSVSSYTGATFSSACLHFTYKLPCLQSVLGVSCSLLSDVSSPPLSSFTQKFSRYSVGMFSFSIKMLQKDKVLITVLTN